MWYRVAELQRFNNGDDIYASLSSIYRWQEDVTRRRQTGNRPSANIVGLDMFLMTIFLFAFPDATEDEIAACLYDQTQQIYSRQDVSRRLTELKLTKKKASTEAYQAFTPENIQKAEEFWSQGPPIGVHGVDRSRHIDIDEAAFTLEMTNRSTGHAHISIRIRKPGHYGRGNKCVVILGIEAGNPNILAGTRGSLMHPRHWIEILDTPGTTADQFENFVNVIGTDLANNPEHPDDASRMYLFDNLASHKAPNVTTAIMSRNDGSTHMPVPRPPYQPKYGPIEYIFCEIGARLRQIAQPGWKFQDLSVNIRNIAAQIALEGHFDRTFAHCGY